MTVLAIDPGNEMSAYVVYDPERHEVLRAEKLENERVLSAVNFYSVAKPADILAIEMVACYGMPVGKTVFETALWTGRFIERWGRDFRLVYRSEVKMHLCGNMRAKDANVRQAIMDLFPATGGGKTPQIGTKAKPGPLYGISGDMFAALGVALTYCEHIKEGGSGCRKGIKIQRTDNEACYPIRTKF